MASVPIDARSVRRYHPLRSGDRVGLDLQFVDQRPGIPNIRRALPDGFSSSGRLGLGLPGTKRFMDEMEIQSEPGKDTVVTVRNGGRNKGVRHAASWYKIPLSLRKPSFLS